jgi:hypothetical protein
VPLKYRSKKYDQYTSLLVLQKSGIDERALDSLRHICALKKMEMQAKAVLQMTTAKKCEFVQDNKILLCVHSSGDRAMYIVKRLV